jgi:hypothetical protein
MKMTVFWDVALCSLVEIDRRFRGAYCLHHQDDRHYEGGSVKRSNTGCKVPEDSHLQAFHRLRLSDLLHCTV